MGMEIKLEEKIFGILKMLQKMSVLDLNRFDVKDGQEGKVYYHKTYVDKAQEAMEGCGGLSLNWCDMSPWQKMCVYKVSDGDGVDCDVALRNVVIYWLAFYKDDEMQEIREQDEKPGSYELVSKQGGILRGDTMNSYATTVHEKLNMLPDTPKNKEIMKAKGIITGKKAKNTKRYYLDPMNKFPAKKSWYWDAVVLEHYEYFKEILSSDFGELEMFVSLVHTLGNFIPVPFKSAKDGEFNRPRGFSRSQDYWDLALFWIHHYYMTKEEDGLRDWILSGKGDPDNNLTLCKEWLDDRVNGSDGWNDNGPDGWNHFVEQNFLQDFVNQENDGYGRPKALWNGHFENQGNKPSGEQFSEFFTNASAWILARGVRIALAVKDQLTDLPEEKLKELARRMAGEEGK